MKHKTQDKTIKITITMGYKYTQEWIMMKRGKSEKSKVLRRSKKRQKKLRSASRHANKRARQLTKRASETELAFQEVLRAEKIAYKFQVPIYSENCVRVVDFYFPRHNLPPLILELDGPEHFLSENMKKDSLRSAWLIQQTGCEIIRFPNYVVHSEPEKILKTLKENHVLYFA